LGGLFVGGDRLRTGKKFCKRKRPKSKNRVS